MQRICVQRRCFSRSGCLLGLEQLGDLPTSSTRKPRNPHRGPLKRLLSPKEEDEWKFLKRWELRMKGEWDANEPFRNQPKPKKLFGNEITEVVWPYSLLVENTVHLHPFTKSIYCYYPWKPLTPQGKDAINLMRDFTRRSLIPITFHNASCYVEAEMLIEYGDTPWAVVHCLDGNHVKVPVTDAMVQQSKEKPDVLLRTIMTEAKVLAEAVAAPDEVWRAYDERPIQNAYVRVNYQWMGDTTEERNQHHVEWYDAAEGKIPTAYQRAKKIQNLLNVDGGLPVSPHLRAQMHFERRSFNKPRPTGSVTFTKHDRHNASNSRWAKLD
jgi:hypothetical protein